MTTLYSTVWVGPIPRIKGQDTNGIIGLAKCDFGSKDVKLLFWCLREHVPYYVKLFSNEPGILNKIQVHSIEDYLDNPPRLEKTDTIYQFEVRRIIKIYLRRNTARDRVSAKELFFLYLLATYKEFNDGCHHVADTNVSPTEKRNPFLTDNTVSNFRMCKIKLKYQPRIFSQANEGIEGATDIMILSAPLNKASIAKQILYNYCEFWWGTEEVLLEEGYSLTYHERSTGLVFDAIRMAAPQYPYSTSSCSFWYGEFINNSTIHFKGIEVLKILNNTHDYRNTSIYNQTTPLNSDVAKKYVKDLAYECFKKREIELYKKIEERTQFICLDLVLEYFFEDSAASDPNFDLIRMGIITTLYKDLLSNDSDKLTFCSSKQITELILDYMSDDDTEENLDHVRQKILSILARFLFKYKSQGLYSGINNQLKEIAFDFYMQFSICSHGELLKLKYKLEIAIHRLFISLAESNTDYFKALLRHPENFERFVSQVHTNLVNFLGLTTKINDAINICKVKLKIPKLKKLEKLKDNVVHLIKELTSTKHFKNSNLINQVVASLEACDEPEKCYIIGAFLYFIGCKIAKNPQSVESIYYMSQEEKNSTAIAEHLKLIGKKILIDFPTDFQIENKVQASTKYQLSCLLMH